MTTNQESLFAKIQSKHANAVVRTELDNPDPFIVINKESLLEVCKTLKDDSDLDMNYLQSMSGVDTTEGVTLVYHFFSYTHKHQLVLKTENAYDDLEHASISSLWPAANWHEREQFDLFGFHFSNHPDLRRILLPEDWNGHPLLKSYEYPEEYHGIDHYRPDPKDQFKALDDLAKKAAAKVKEQAEKKAAESAGSVEAAVQAESPQNADGAEQATE